MSGAVLLRGRQGKLVSCLLVALSLLSLGFGPPQLTDSDQPRTPTSGYHLGLMAQDQPPTLSARAALIMDRATGEVVYERQGRLRLAPASTTKIMTAIVALERGRLSDKVVVSYEHLRSLEGTGSSIMGLLVGDVVTLEDLLWGMLLPSGNDAALVVASMVGGTVDGFARLMNAKASELGLRDTHFVNPHGLDVDDHYSSAYDLAVMGRYALNNPTFARIVSSPRHVIHASRDFTLVNTNRLLDLPDLLPGVDGIKTGTTDNAGECIVASATRDGRAVIVVVLGSQGRVADTVALTNYAYSGFEWLPLPQPAFPFVPDGTGATWTVASPPRWEMIPPWQRFRIHLSIRMGGAQAAGGQHLGTAIYQVGEKILELPLQPLIP